MAAAGFPNESTGPEGADGGKGKGKWKGNGKANDEGKYTLQLRPIWVLGPGSQHCPSWEGPSDGSARKMMLRGHMPWEPASSVVKTASQKGKFAAKSESDWESASNPEEVPQVKKGAKAGMGERE